MYLNYCVYWTCKYYVIQSDFTHMFSITNKPKHISVSSVPHYIHMYILVYILLQQPTLLMEGEGINWLVIPNHFSCFIDVGYRLLFQMITGIRRGGPHPQNIGPTIVGPDTPYFCMYYQSVPHVSVYQKPSISPYMYILRTNMEDNKAINAT